MLNHPKIVNLYSYYELNEYVMLLMEYLDNGDLKNFIKNFRNKKGQNNLSELLCGHFMVQLLESLYYLKMKNIIHRDIKPDNIMLTSNFDAKLGDFSLSKIINENSKYTTSRSGTLPYLAPECVTKKTELTYQSSFKADVFSLGIVMYFFLFNSHPFQYKVKIIYLYFLEFYECC